MKYATALLVAVVKADAPAAYNEPPFSEGTHPAAAGLIQLNTESVCAVSGLNGITCGPSDEELFANGMVGDEDLSLNIHMKGTKLNSYNQKLLMIESAEEPEDNTHVQFANGEAGDADMGLLIHMKGDKLNTYS